MIRQSTAALAFMMCAGCAFALDVPVVGQAGGPTGTSGQGNYNQAGARVSTTVYQTGFLAGERRGYFIFDLSSIPNTQSVSSATLTINTFNVTFGGSRTLTIYDVSQANIAGLLAGTTSTSIFNDLGSGAAYATRSYSTADGNQAISITLNSAAVNDINSVFGTGYFAVGFQLTAPPTSSDRVFQGSSVSASNQLTLSLVPEPSSFALLVMGLGGVVYRRRRARVATPQ